MKIIEALKELPLLEKRINSNIEKISQYAAGVDTTSDGTSGFVFNSSDEQRKQVASLIQSNEDLIKQRASLRRNLYNTNIQVMVEINGEKKSIAEWIEYREKGFYMLESTYRALNDMRATNELRQTKVDPSVGARVVRFYTETDKNDMVNKMEAIRDQLTSQLEIVNATTDLIEV